MVHYEVGAEPVPGYKLTRFLGQGAFGQVWEARGPGGVDVALKIIPLHDGNGLKEFRAVGLVKKLHNPNLVPLHGYWLKDRRGKYYDPSSQDSISLVAGEKQLIIAMGLGQMSLATRLKECRDQGLRGIPSEELLDYMTGAARAIDYLNQPIHNLGGKEPAAIHHGDIKPGNLLIVGNGVQVCDYGLARALSEDARKTQGAGSPAYCPPEQFANKPHPRSDQYALAISYYELRTGVLPLDESAAAYAHINGTLDFSLAAPLEQDVLRKATHIRPDERYPTTSDFVRALRDAVAQKPSGRVVVAPAASLDERIAPGSELVPHYKLVKLKGRGGYGEVWEAKGPGGTRCAIKIVRNLEATKGNQERKALKHLLDLEHDRLINLRAYWLLAADGTILHDDDHNTESGLAANTLVMVTDLAEKNLLHRLQECQMAGQTGLPLDELASYMRQAAEAIDYLNDNGLQHRDIKPENILVTRDGRVKVSDFGLAKVVQGMAADIGTESVGLTTAYAAPELFRNSVSRWTDQYSLALTYYKLRTGRWPFKSDLGPLQIMVAHTEGKLDLSGVPDAERLVLAKATAVDPARRYASCREFAAELYVAGGGTLAELPSGPPLADTRSSATENYIESKTSAVSSEPPAPEPTYLPTVGVPVVPVPPLAAEPPARRPAPVAGTLMLHRDAIAELEPQSQSSTDDIGRTVESLPAAPRTAARQTPSKGRGALLMIAGVLVMAAGAVGAYFAFGPRPATETKGDESPDQARWREVTARLDAGDFAGAARLLRAGKPSPEQQAHARSAWTKAAAAEGDEAKRLRMYDEYLDYFDDADARRERDALRRKRSEAPAPVTEAGRQARDIETRIPTLTAATDWAKLLDECKAATPTPDVVACRAECVAELRRTADVAAARAELANVARSPYAAYAQARLDDLAGDLGEAAARLADAYPPGPPPPALAAPLRVQRSADILARAFDRRAVRPEAKALAASAAGVRLVDLSGANLTDTLKTALRVRRLMLLANPTGDESKQLAAALASADLSKLRPEEHYAALAPRRADAAAVRTALRLARDNPSALPPARVYADLVKPALEGDADADVYAAAAQAIRGDVKGWEQVPGVGKGAGKLILGLYDRATRREDRPEFAVGRLLAEFELNGKIDLPAWQAAARRSAGNADPESLILQGAVLLREVASGGLTADAVAARLTEADRRFETALKVRDIRPEDKALALAGRSSAALRRANYTAGRAERRVALNDAEQHANDMLALDREKPAAWVAVGMALEDRALLLGEAAKYADAAEKFTEAVRLAGDDRPDVAVHLGRCQYRWGEATRNAERLADAQRRLEAAAADAGATDAVAAEANYFLAKALVAQRSLLLGKDAAKAADACRAAESAFRKAEAAAKAAPAWLQSVLSDWGWLVTDEAFERITAKKKPTERLEAYKNDAEVARLLDDADAIAARLKPVSAARAAYVRGRAARWRTDPDDKTAFERALAAFAEGLASKRLEDRDILFDMRNLRAGIYRALGKPELRLEELQEAERLAKELGRPARDRAECAALTAETLEQLADKGTKERREALAKYREAATLYEESLAAAAPGEREVIAKRIRELREKK